ncbi:Uncharacterised protein [uncultured archaeon]|nr:Uncharacterised protein [uncultured archaeon]
MAAPTRRFKVVTTFTVEVTEEELLAAERIAHQEVDPKKIAVFKAMTKAVEVVVYEGHWGEGVMVYFDVEEVVN